MSEAPVRVLIVDDDDLMRAGLRGVLSSDDAIEVNVKQRLQISPQRQARATLEASSTTHRMATPPTEGRADLPRTLGVKKFECHDR